MRTGWQSLGLIGLVLALPAGAAADRYPRKRLIQIAQVGLALSGLGLAWVSITEGPIAWTYAFLLGTGIFRAIGWPASQAIVTGLVPTKLFANATPSNTAGEVRPGHPDAARGRSGSLPLSPCSSLSICGDPGHTPSGREVAVAEPLRGGTSRGPSTLATARD